VERPDSNSEETLTSCVVFFGEKSIMCIYLGCAKWWQVACLGWNGQRKCIGFSAICNGVYDCADLWDEQHCAHSQLSY